MDWLVAGLGLLWMDVMADPKAAQGRELRSLLAVFVVSLVGSVYGSARFPLVDEDYVRGWLLGTFGSAAVISGAILWHTYRLRRRGEALRRPALAFFGCFGLGLCANHGPGLLLLANALGDGAPERKHELTVLAKGQTNPPPPIYYAFLGAYGGSRLGYVVVPHWRQDRRTATVYESWNLGEDLLARLRPGERIQLRTRLGWLGFERILDVVTSR